MSTKTNPHATLASLVSNFTIGAIGDRPESQKKVAARALELTKDLEDTAPEKMLAYALDYGASQGLRRKELEERLELFQDRELRLRVHELAGAIADGRKRLLPLLEAHDAGSEELEGLLLSLRGELDGLSRTLREDFYVERPQDSEVGAREKRLAATLKKIRDARDFFAEHQEWPASGGPAADQGFDDWAADLADGAL